MTPAVTLAVLVAALCHASWNALVRVGGDKLVTVALLTAGSAVLALPGLLVVPPLDRAAWPFLAASVAIHTAYMAFLSLAYHHGELSKAYPLLRGSAPLMTLGLSLAFLAEPVGAGGSAGVVLLALGIMTLALDGGWRALLASPRGLVYAIATAICIALYTISDGLGARASGNAHVYVLWLFVLSAIPLVLATAALRRAAFLRSVTAHWKVGLLSGFLSLAAYWIVIWAMTVAPIPLVAALRETSILFAALIGTIVLGERMSTTRIASILLVILGLAVMRLA